MDLRIADMMAMQKALHQLHESEWFPLEPAFGQHSILYMIEEIGEAIAVLKKKGDQAVMHDASVRAAFLEELADVLNYALILADKYNFDVIDIVKEKIERNALKYPVEKAKGTAKKYTEL